MNETFEERAVWLMEKLLPDFPAWGIDDAAADVGNAGGESEILMIQEAGMTPPNGGFGIYQWSGARRTEFESYCTRTKRDPNALQSGYDFHFVELKGTYANVIGLVAAAPDLDSKVVAFEEHYEMAGIPRMGARDQFAARAKAAYVAKHGASMTPAPAPINPSPAPAPPPPAPPDIGTIITEAFDLYSRIAPLIPEGVKTAIANMAIQAVLGAVTSAQPPAAAPPTSQGSSIMNASTLKVVIAVIQFAVGAGSFLVPPPFQPVLVAILGVLTGGHALVSATSTDK